MIIKNMVTCYPHVEMTEPTSAIVQDSISTVVLLLTYLRQGLAPEGMRIIFSYIATFQIPA